MGSARPFLAVALIWLVAGCAGRPVPTAHIVMFDGDGTPLDPGRPEWAGYAELEESTGGAFDAYLDEIVAGIQTFMTNRAERHVLVFVHGGLNTQSGTVDRATQLHKPIRAAGLYPIFVNWRSSLFNSYCDHLFFVRQGRRAYGPSNDAVGDVLDGLGTLLFPFYLVGDVARAVARFPIVAWHQIKGTAEWTGLIISPEREAADRATRLLTLPSPDSRPSFLISEGRQTEPWLSAGGIFGRMARGGRWLLFSPLKIVSTLFIDAGGTSSWEVMNRRVDLLFQREAEFDGRRPQRRAAGLLALMQRLHALQQADPGLEVTLVGHSMGAIVVNRLLAEAQTATHVSDTRGENEPHLPRFRNIVYLGAACTLRDYQDSAFAYLLHDDAAQVFHVVLHPDAELSEAPYWDLAPRGSLLTWIDDFLAKPLTPIDRTAGRYTNLMPALYATPEELRPRVHVRVLEESATGQPGRHGDFNDELDAFAFWSRDSWFLP